jgi:uncharacterized membrane protein YgcG
MRVFLLDLWLDLREKRLAPLAIILLAAIVAVPIVLANDQEETTPPPTATTATTASVAPVVQSDAGAGPTESKLQTFNPRDPFEPTSSAATTSTGTSSTGSTTGTSGGTTGTGTSTTESSGGGGGTTGSAPSTGTGTGTGTNGTGNTTGETRTTLFTYTVDLRFGEGGDVKAYKKVQRLDLIPNADTPKVVFLGVTTTGKTAVFLVDANIGVDTGGRCRPSPDECSFLYLRPDDEHDEALLTDSDGTVYHLRLLDIDRVSVSSSNGSTGGSGNSGSGNTNSNRSPAFTGRANREDTSDDATVPGESTPPGEPAKRSSFQQFFADGASDSE